MPGHPIVATDSAAAFKNVRRVGIVGIYRISPCQTAGHQQADYAWDPTRFQVFQLNAA
jgi:hypothetical protein